MPNQSRKSKIKGWITALIIIAILAAALIGAAAYYKYVYSKAYVQDVENLNYTWVLTPETTQGRVSESATQNVYLSSSDVLDKVFVAQGDRVEIGDALFQYDVEALQSNVEQASLDVDVATMKLNIEMIRLQNAVDIKPRPTDKEIEDIMDRNEKQYEEEIQKLDDEYNAKLEAAEAEALRQKKAYIAAHEFAETAPGTPKAGNPVCTTLTSGGGLTEADPFVYTLPKDAIISAETIEKWRGKQADPNDPTNKQYYYYKLTTTDGTETYEWIINKNTAPMSGGEYYDVMTKESHIFASAADVTPPDYSSIKDPNSGLDFHGYTQEEKDKKVAEEQVAVLKAQTDLKSMQHKLKEAQNKLDNATVRANMPGIVQSVGDAENPPKDGSPFVVITGESGMAVIGYVSELKLGSIKVGDEYTVYSWETGNTTTAKV
nr:biotin/lipoyl-binding protein [Lachnospiraceae bacterium]